MVELQLKHTDIHNLQVNHLKSFLEGKEYREFIEFFLMDNKKGENGLIFKELLKNLSSQEEEILKEEVEKFNDVAMENKELWRKPAITICEDLIDSIQNKGKVGISENKKAYLFLLFSMNYVFSSYTNRGFRKFIGVNKRNYLLPFKIK